MPISGGLDCCDPLAATIGLEPLLAFVCELRLTLAPHVGDRQPNAHFLLKSLRCVHFRSIPFESVRMAENGAQVMPWSFDLRTR